MVRPSNPKLMARVLEAVTHLGDGKGSLTRDVLRFVKQNSSQPPRNLTMQVRRALKHAVNAGLLRFKSGRYKMQLELNPVSHGHRHEEKTQYKKTETLNKMSDDSPMNSIDLSRKVQDRRKSGNKKRSAQKMRKRSRTRGTKRKVTRRRTTAINKRSRNISKHPRRKTAKDVGPTEDWSARKRRMMSQPKFEENDDDEEEEAEEGEEEEEDIPETRRMPRMKSVHEDRYSDASGDSSVVGRHRSRRSKHLANVENRSPSRRGNGDNEGHRKPTKRSTSRRRRSQPRQRDNRQVPAPEEPTEQNKEPMDEERENDVMEMDEDQGDVEGTGTPPENQGLE